MSKIKQPKAPSFVLPVFKQAGVKIKKFKKTQQKPRTLLHSKKIEQAHFILGFLGYFFIRILRTRSSTQSP